MTRLAKRLGLEGYDQVRELYAGAVRAGTLGFAGKAGVQVEAQKLRGERALAAEMAQRLSRQIAALAEPASLERLADAAGRLHEARRVYCLGLRSCHAAAWHFHYMLSLLGDKTVMLDDAGGTGLDAIRDAGPADVLLAASVEPYARATIDGARYAAGQGVPVVALTDSEVSPLAQIAVAADPGGDRQPLLLPHHDAACWPWPKSSPPWSPAAAATRRWRRWSTPRRSSRRSASTCRGAATRESMTHILHRQIGGDLPVAAGGKGIEIVDTAGKRYLDASGGAAVSCLGHGHPAVTAALHEQLDKLAYAHTGFFTTDVAEKLADRLIADAPQGISHAYLVSGGSEAIEAALKMARQYFIERGQTRRRHVIARRQSYHGNTLGALAAGGNEWRRAPFSPLLIETHHIDPCFAYRFQEPGETRGSLWPSAPPMRSKPRSSSSAPTRSWLSSPRRWSAPPPAPCRRPKATSSASARSATATACC